MITDPVTSFIGQLRQTNLLDAAHLGEVERLRQTSPQLGHLARELVQRGWLTPYQANQLALGRGTELVIGSYVVLAPLGSGGMGQIVKARHRIMNRDVALKLIRQDQRDSADTVERFRREICLLADLRHPYIVQAYDAGQFGELWFLAMELLQGTDLEQLVRQRGPLPVAEACEHLRQAALGLHHAHQRGLVHRDVKPSNFFLTSEGIKVLDLGLARPQRMEAAQTGNLTQLNTVMGTPDYLAPEQALDPRRADARSDLYGLGCTLHFLLTGSPPFPEGTLAQKLLAHQQAEPPPVERVRPDVTPPVAHLLHQMLAKNPADRPPSALEVAQRLAPFAAGTTNSRSRAGGGSVSAAAPTSEQRSAVRSNGPTPPAGQPVPSLVEPGAAAPEHGWTLLTEATPPPAAPAAPADSRIAGAQRDLTLMGQALPPRAIPVPSPPVDDQLARRRRLLNYGILGSLGLFSVCLLICLVGLIFSGSRPAESPSPSGNQGQPDGQAAGQPRPVDKSDGGKDSGKPPPAEVKAKPPPLEAKGPKETEGVFVMSTIAPDKALASRKTGDKIFLSDMNEFAFKPWPFGWPFVKNGRVGDPKDPNRMIRVNGSGYPKGLGMHPPYTDYVRVCFALARQAASLQGSVALDDGEDRPWQIKTTTFVVLGDGKVLWRSHGITDRGVVEPFNVDVRGVSVLELRVYTDYNGANGSPAVWLDPYVMVGK
jgi:serine/threonine protein kinase